MDREFLKGLELEKEAIDKIMAEYGKGIEKHKSEAEKFKQELATEQKARKDLETKVFELSKSGEDAAKLKEELEKIKSDNAKRSEDEAKAKSEAELNAKIEGVFGESKFLSDYVKRGLMQDIRAEFEKDNTKGLKEIFNSLTKDEKGNVKPGIFESQHKPAEIPPMGTTGNGSVFTKEKLSGMTAEEINTNWEAISRQLPNLK